jgi:hypothetical protein
MPWDTRWIMMTTKNARVTVAGVLTSVVVIAAAAVAGAFLGLLFVALFVPKTGMGWDQIADALGGLMLGGLIGIGLGIALAVTLDVRRKLIATAICIAIAGVTIGGLALSRPKHPASSPAVPGDATARPLTTVPG